jgi:hypothetical protein
MKYLKAFIAGLAFPAIILPFVLLILNLVGKLDILGALPVYLLPLIWGVWNVFYFKIEKRCPIKCENCRLFASGACLGLLVAFLAVFVFKAPTLLGFTGAAVYAPLVIIPAVYAILWRYIVKYFNFLIGLKEW